MKKYFFILALLIICGNAFGQIEKEPIVAEKTSDYWVYVRLEDRSGVTKEDDAGRSKAGDVVAVLPVSPQHKPSETEKKSYMIYKASLTETKRQEMLEPWVEETTTKDGDVIEMPKAYRKNKLDTSKLGVEVKKGLVTEKIDATKIDYQVKTSDDLAMYELKRKFYAYVQRPAIRLANVITRKAFAGTVSTINKTGEDYNTITLWEDDKDGDLVTDTRQETGEVYKDDGELKETVVIDGSTTNSSYYMKLTVAEASRHDGTAGSGFVLNKNATYALSAYDEYTVIEWIEIDGNGSTGTSSNNTGIACNSSNFTFRYNIIHDFGSQTGTGRGIFNTSESSRSGIDSYNNIIYNIFATSTGGAKGIDYGAGTKAGVICNNTIYNITSSAGTAYGIVGNFSASGIIKNNIVIGSTTADFSFSSATHDYNASSDATADGANSLNSGTAKVPSTSDFVSVTSGSENLHLAAGAVEIDKGVDLSGTFTDDIDGVTRTGTWDIGADEYVARNRLMIIQ